MARGLHGGIYPYFFCLGRQRGKVCDQPHIPVHEVEQQVADFYRRQEIPAALVQQLREGLRLQLREERQLALEEAARQKRYIEKLKGQRKKLLQAHYDDLIDAELFEEEQQRIKAEVIAAETAIAEAEDEWGEVQRAHDQLFDQVGRWGDLFELASDQQRRRISRALWQRILVDAQEEIRAVPADPPAPGKVMRYLERARYAFAGAEIRRAFEIVQLQNPPLISTGVGSNIVTLVRAEGLEPPSSYEHENLNLACLPVPTRPQRSNISVAPSHTLTT